jgi:histidinol-phosphate aminotransferase
MKSHLKDIYRKSNQEDKTKFKYVLTQNERNYPLADLFVGAFFNSLNQKDICFYPNTSRLKEKICKYYNIDIDNLLLTPGSSFAIKTIFETFNVKGNNVVTSDYFFPMYQVYSDLYECELRKAKYTGMKLDINKIIELVDEDTQFIILANPNSPLGDLYTKKDIIKLLETGVFVVIDEAYLEFTGEETSIPLIEEYKNLIVTKTFSKAYGAAGCRVGFLVSHIENMEYLSKFRSMYEINAIGAKYTELIMDNIEYFQSYFQEMMTGKKNFITKLKNEGYSIIDTQGSWFYLERFTDKDNLEYFNNLGMSFRTLILPDGKEYVKFNYDLTLNEI